MPNGNLASERASDATTNLSRRELEVLAMVSRGLSNIETAKSLDVTIYAVKFHLASIYRKLSVKNRTEATVAYLQGPPRSRVSSSTDAHTSSAP